MSEFDSTRVAMIVAIPAHGGSGGGHRENLATGYFLTGDLVLTVRHIAEGPDWTFSVRAEVGGPAEADLWTSATPEWVGVGDVDAMLLRTPRRFGNWTPPKLDTRAGSGAWRSSGFARAAEDKAAENRKTLPLYGSFGMSLGQGSPQIALQANQSISADWEAYWRGISGAPIFAIEPDGKEASLIGLITEATKALSNGLMGLPAARLIDDIGFRSVITPSFLGPMPESPFCAVLTSEGSGSDLVGQTEDVLAGFRSAEAQFHGLSQQPFQIPAIEAVQSPENWAAAVGVLARADYLVADVTQFEPAIMLLLGIRSVLRRGVTISVAKEQPMSSTLELPFNIQETKILFCDDAEFYDNLHLAMSTGAANLSKDPNYLDLPAYHAVRAPRPENWASADDKTLLVLCPFSTDYSAVYRGKIRPILRAHTGNMIPLRTMDMQSPRLVGQALYEQMRWSSWCLADWTEWRPNVFFELGARLACSERDPLCIIQRGDTTRATASADEASRAPRQQELLLRLFDPVVYEPANPRDALRPALEVWPRPPSSGSGRPLAPTTLPPAATFRTAQAGFQWKHDAALTAPHAAQRRAAELVFGSDQERLPQGRVLFALNEQFDEALRGAVRENWIATWLYLRHLSTGDLAAELRYEAELRTVGSLADYALSSSDDPRHIGIRKEIAEFLQSRKAHETPASAPTTAYEVPDEILALKAAAKSARDTDKWDAAITHLTSAVVSLSSRITDARAVMPGWLAAELADVYGLLGGVEKRWALTLTGENRRDHLAASLSAYDKGFGYEQDLRSDETYNRVNRLVGRVLLNPRALDPDYAVDDFAQQLRKADNMLTETVQSTRQKDPWAYCDLGTVRLLRNSPDALLVFQDLDRLRPPVFVYYSTLATLLPLAEVAADLRPELTQAIAHLQRSARYLE